MKVENIKKYLTKAVMLAVFPMMLAACGSGAASEESGSSAETTRFPSSLAVSSPLSYSGTESASVSRTSGKTAAFTAVTSYSEIADAIAAMTSSSSSSSCTFDASLFLAVEDHAGCYGPSIMYENHPDATTGPADGTFPILDLGIWTEVDDATGDACIAAEYNAQMESNAERANASLMALASLICTANANSVSLPSSTNPNVDLTVEMNALGVTDTTFASATMSYDSTSGTYSYNIEMTYNPGTVHAIEVDMEHTPGTGAAFSGKYSYLVDDTFTGGNCPTSDVTRNGSVEYELDSSGMMKTQVRSALFCEHGSDGRDAGIVDAGDKYSSSNATGWGNDFSIATANYDATTLSGDYAYSWQAGPGDDNSRTFNLTYDGSAQTAQAWYGYSDDIDGTDGSITGFICNWAGPGDDHSMVEYAQYQEMSAVTNDDGSVTIHSDDANITYAPTVSCEYDGTGSFVFDTNIDDDLSDEDPLLAVSNDLMAGVDTNTDGDETIEEYMDTTSFTLPTM